MEKTFWFFLTIWFVTIAIIMFIGNLFLTPTLIMNIIPWILLILACVSLIINDLKGGEQ